jgi:hypothetical protein
MKTETAWFLFAALVLSTCSALAYFSKKKRPEIPPIPPMFATAPPAYAATSPPPERELPPTIIPLPTGFGTDQRVYLSDVRGGNAGLLSYDPVWRGGWLGLNLP